MLVGGVAGIRVLAGGVHLSNECVKQYEQVIYLVEYTLGPKNHLLRLPWQGDQRVLLSF